MNGQDILTAEPVEAFIPAITFRNETGADVSEHFPVILSAIRNGGKLPDDLAELFRLDTFDAAGTIKAVLSWV